MREYKFRGKRIDNGKWEYGNLLQSEDQCFIATSFLTPKDKDMPLMVAAYEVDPETVGQATGLVDRNGVEVFENDIVEIPYNGLGRKVVKYLQDELKYNISVYKLSEIYVIGNITDNPELLER